MFNFTNDLLNKLKYTEEEKLIEAGEKPLSHTEKVDYRGVQLTTLFQPL